MTACVAHENYADSALDAAHLILVVVLTPLTTGMARHSTYHPLAVTSALVIVTIDARQCGSPSLGRDGRTDRLRRPRRPASARQGRRRRSDSAVGRAEPRRRSGFRGQDADRRAPPPKPRVRRPRVRGRFLRPRPRLARDPYRS